MARRCAALFKAAGLPPPDLRAPFAPAAHAAIAVWALGKTRRQLDALARTHDIPLYTLGAVVGTGPGSRIIQSAK